MQPAASTRHRGSVYQHLCWRPGPLIPNNRVSGIATIACSSSTEPLRSVPLTLQPIRPFGGKNSGIGAGSPVSGWGSCVAVSGFVQICPDSSRSCSVLSVFIQAIPLCSGILQFPARMSTKQTVEPWHRKIVCSDRIRFPPRNSTAAADRGRCCVNVDGGMHSAPVQAASSILFERTPLEHRTDLRIRERLMASQ